MERAKKILLNCILYSFLALLVLILYMALIDNEKIVFEYNTLLLLLGVVAYIALLVFVSKKIVPKLVELKWLPYVLFALFFIICILVSNDVKVNPSWDMGRVFNLSKDYALTGKTVDVYLYQYPNNIMISVIYIGIMKLGQLLTVADFLTYATVMNAFIVSLTVVLLYYVAKKMYDEKKAMMVLLIALFTSPLYLYGAEYYTDTFSMFMIMLTFFTYLVMREQKSIPKKITLQIILGILLVVAFKVKVTAVFIVIALLVYRILTDKPKSILRDFVFVIPTAMIVLIISNLVLNAIYIPNKEISDQEEMPIEHWIWMGLKGAGGYDEEDYAYTRSFKTYEERKQANREALKTRIKEYDVNSFIKHIRYKIWFAWCDGTYFVPEVLRREPVNQGVLFEYVSRYGTKTNYYKYWPQIMHVGMLALIAVNVYTIIKKKKYQSKDITLFIAIYGLIVFLLIWENRSRYVLTLLPIMLLAMLNGIQALEEKAFHKKKQIVTIDSTSKGEENGKNKGII